MFSARLYNPGPCLRMSETHRAGLQTIPKLNRYQNQNHESHPISPSGLLTFFDMSDIKRGGVLLTHTLIFLIASPSKRYIPATFLRCFPLARSFGPPFAPFCDCTLQHTSTADSTDSLPSVICTASGFVITKADIFPAVAARGAGQVILNIAFPCLMFSKIVPAFTSQNVHALGVLASK